jgi:maltooligosyltrehalose trehalohydrolase
LIFMGEEYGERHPFPFFCSFYDAGLIEAVRNGRRKEFADMEFDWSMEIPDPQSPETFLSAKLFWAWPEGSLQAKHRLLYQDLLTARRQWPALRDREHTKARLINPELEDQNDPSSILLLERGGENALLAVANLSDKTAMPPALVLSGKHVLLCTEDVRYGGSRLDSLSLDRLLPYELLVLGGS